MTIVSSKHTGSIDMTSSTPAVAALPETGYIRQAQLIGEPAITLEQARANKLAGKSPRRPRAGSAAIIPWSSATLWRKVKSREFVAPVKLSEGVTAWRVEAVRAWIDGRAAAA